VEEERRDGWRDVLTAGRGGGGLDPCTGGPCIRLGNGLVFDPDIPPGKRTCVPAVFLRPID
jgi:hypothetical protein